jgi:hypothetical protein
VGPELEKGASIPEATLEASEGPNRSRRRGRKEIKVTDTPTEGRGSKKRPLTSHIYLYGAKFQREGIEWWRCNECKVGGPDPPQEYKILMF